MPRKSELQVSVERLDVKLTEVESAMGAGSKRPTVAQIRSLITLGNRVVSEYEKANRARIDRINAAANPASG